MSHKRYHPGRAPSWSCAFVIVVTAACSGANIIGPGNQLEVANTADAFAFQVSALENVTQTLTYSWTITGPDATVNIAGAVSSGTAVVTITDAQSVQVFSRSLDGSSNPSTDSGTAGTWTITVDLAGVSGTLNFRVEKKP